MEPKTEKKRSKVDMGAALPKDKAAGPSGRAFQASGQDFKLQAAQSLKFQALGSLQLEILARTLKSSPGGGCHFFLGESCP